MSQQERQNLEQLLDVFRLRRAKLHKQAATFGLFVPEHLHIEIQNLQKEIVQLESRLALLLPSSSDERTSLRRHRAHFFLLLFLTGLLLLYVFALPYLKLRLYAEATLWALPPPATAWQVTHEMNVSVTCGRVVSTTLYHTDSTWLDLKAHYTAHFQQSGWFTQPSDSALVGFWRFKEPHNEDTPQLIVSIRPQILSDSMLLHEKYRSRLDQRDQRYVMILEYIGDQRGYRTCFHD